jgi:hypothetical protein
MNFQDYVKPNEDNSGDWETISDINKSRLSNFIKIAPNELKFLPDGIDIMYWLKSQIKLPVDGFILWLKQQLLIRNYPIKHITYKVDISGDLILQIILVNNSMYSTKIAISKTTN